MNHKEVYKALERHLPSFFSQTSIYFPNGKNSIRIRLKDGNEFVFSFNNDDIWKLETRDQHLIEMKTKKKGA